MALEKVQVRNRWTGVDIVRRGSPRSTGTVRARIAHTSAQKRRLDIFVSEPVARALGWVDGGSVRAGFNCDGKHFLARLTPAHSGIRATRPYSKSGTLRVAVTGAPITSGMCAKVREVSFTYSDGNLVAFLPMEWALEYCAATGVDLVEA